MATTIGDVRAEDLEYLDTYEDGALCVVVETGQPERNVRVGTGETWREAVESLKATPLQSVGRDNGRSAALRWACHADWISTETPTAVEVDWESES